MTEIQQQKPRIGRIGYRSEFQVGPDGKKRVVLVAEDPEAQQSFEDALREGARRRGARGELY